MNHTQRQYFMKRIDEIAAKKLGAHGYQQTKWGESFADTAEMIAVIKEQRAVRNQFFIENIASLLLKEDKMDCSLYHGSNIGDWFNLSFVEKFDKKKEKLLKELRLKRTAIVDRIKADTQNIKDEAMFGDEKEALLALERFQAAEYK